MLIYGLKNCDTCRKAIKALPDAQLVDVRKDGVPADVLAAHPALMKRPLIAVGEDLFLGWNDATEAKVKAAQ